MEEGGKHRHVPIPILWGIRIADIDGTSIEWYWSVGIDYSSVFPSNQQEYTHIEFFSEEPKYTKGMCIETEKQFKC
jgi:hypothetical protein